MAYDQDVDSEVSHRIWKVRFFEMGHTEEEIDNMSLAFQGDIIGYFSEKGRAEEHLAKQKQRLSRK